MATTTAPLLSFGASGQIAKTQVYSTWRGIPYVRRHVVPANPQSTAQTQTRSMFTFCSNMWKSMAAAAKAPWTAYATGQQFYDRNAFIGQNVKAMRAGVDLTTFVGSPGAKGGIPPANVSAVGAAGGGTITFTLPAAPAGWAITGAVAMAQKAGDPHTITMPSAIVVTGLTPFTTAVFAGLSAATYEVSCWLTWTKSDGSLAYSPSLNTQFTAT